MAEGFRDVLREYEKMLSRLKVALNDSEERYLKLLAEYREYRQSTDLKLLALASPASALVLTKGPKVEASPNPNQKPARPNIPGDVSLNSPEVTPEKLAEIFHDR